ncbi:ATP-dependent dethiobiotin synthetase BioD [Burkholderiaceae bacterium UC74_6]
MKGFFITGTDTEIGKTTTTAGLVHLFQQQGRRVTPIKSLAAGTEVDGPNKGINEDVARLHAAQTLGLTPEQICPPRAARALRPAHRRQARGPQHRCRPAAEVHPRNGSVR